MFGKSISTTQQTGDNALALVRLAGLHWASLMLVFTENTLALKHLRTPIKSLHTIVLDLFQPLLLEQIKD